MTQIISGRTFIFLLTGIGIILVWRGVWETTEKFFSPEASIVFGVGILVIVAILEKRPLFKYFGLGGK